jgi:TPR repeat protein
MAFAKRSVLLAVGLMMLSAQSHAQTNPLSAAEKDYESAVEYAYGMNKVRIDDTKAVEFVSRAAAQGLPEAEAGLAYLTSSGSLGVTKDTPKGEELAHRALAHELVARANEGRANAQNALARLYREGLGLARDLGKAAELYQKAALQGDSVAQFALGVYYLQGSGVAKDPKKAVALFRQAADQGNSVAQTNLAYAYEIGVGVEKDLKKAIELYEKASAQGDEIAQANFQRLRLAK